MQSHDGGARDTGDVLDTGDAIGDDAAMGPMICVDDDFSGSSLDPARWTTYGASQGVVTSLVSGLAEISVPAFVARIDNVGTCTAQDAHLAHSR